MAGAAPQSWKDVPLLPQRPGFDVVADVALPLAGSTMLHANLDPLRCPAPLTVRHDRPAPAGHLSGHGATARAARRRAR